MFDIIKNINRGLNAWIEKTMKQSGTTVTYYYNDKKVKKLPKEAKKQMDKAFGEMGKAFEKMDETFKHFDDFFK